jgi:hypothetical protein
MSLVTISMVIGGVALVSNVINLKRAYSYGSKKYVAVGLACILANSVLLYTLYNLGA